MAGCTVNYVQRMCGVPFEEKVPKTGDRQHSELRTDNVWSALLVVHMGCEVECALQFLFMLKTR